MCPPDRIFPLLIQYDPHHIHRQGTVLYWPQLAGICGLCQDEAGYEARGQARTGARARGSPSEVLRS